MEPKLADIEEGEIQFLPFAPAVIKRYTSGGCHLLAYKTAELMQDVYPVSIITVGSPEASYHSAVSVMFERGEAIVDIGGVQTFQAFKTIWSKILGAFVDAEEGFYIHRTAFTEFYPDGITPTMRVGLSEEGEVTLQKKMAEITEDVDVVSAMVAAGAVNLLTMSLGNPQSHHLPAPADQTPFPEPPPRQ